MPVDPMPLDPAPVVEPIASAASTPVIPDRPRSSAEPLLAPHRTDVDAVIIVDLAAARAAAVEAIDLVAAVVRRAAQVVGRMLDVVAALAWS